MRPTTNEIRQALKTAFGVETTKQLKKFIRCDMRRRDEMLHAVAVIWNNQSNYPQLQDALVLQDILEATSKTMYQFNKSRSSEDNLSFIQAAKFAKRFKMSDLRLENGIWVADDCGEAYLITAANYYGAREAGDLTV